MNIVKEILGDTIKNRYVSVFSIIKFICKSRRPLLIWDDVLEEYGEDAISLVTYHIYDKERLSSMGFMGCHIPYIDVKDIVKLLLMLPGKTADKLRLYKIHDDDFTEDEIISSIICKQDEHFIVNGPFPPIGGKPQEQSSSIEISVNQENQEQSSSSDVILEQSSSTTYDINNLLVSTFKDNNITIYGTWEDPLFRAKDIGDLLGIEKIRKTLENIDDNMKVKTNAPSRGVGSNSNYKSDTWFLTEEGLYELLYISRKPMAKEFRAHVSKLLKEQRLKLGEHLKNQNLLEVAKERESHLLEKFKDCAGVYFLNNPIMRLCKFGSSKNVSKRVKEHRRDFGEQFRLHHVVKTPKYADLENGVRRFQNTEHNGHVEIISYEDDNELQSIYKNTERESRLLSYEESNDLEIRKMEYQCEIEKEKTKQLEIQSKIRLAEIQLEIEKLRTK